MKKARELLLLRHAQAQGKSNTGRDFDRLLSEHGRSQPEPVAQALLAAGFRPQLVLCSASARTRETLSLILRSTLCEGAEIEYSQAIYECTVRRILMQLSAVDTCVERVLLVGHNPGLSDLATALSNRPVGLSPGEYAWIEFEGDWANIDAGTARLK